MSLRVAPLALSGEDQVELERLARSGDRRLQERAGVVPACGDSAEGNSWAAAELGLSVETVRKRRSRFAERGSAGLAAAPRPGRRKAALVLTCAEREQLARWARRGETPQMLALRADRAGLRGGQGHQGRGRGAAHRAQRGPAAGPVHRPPTGRARRRALPRSAAVDPAGQVRGGRHRHPGGAAPRDRALTSSQTLADLQPGDVARSAPWRW
jgi:transposase